VANRVYLMNHEHREPLTAAQAESACLLGANYQIPVLWVALFRAADLTTMPVSCTADSGEEVIESVPTLFTTSEKARATYTTRSSALVKALGAENSSFIQEWESFLASEVRAPFLQLDLGELWMMYDPRSDLEVDLRDWLEAVDTRSGREWNSLSSQANLGREEVRRYGIRGFPWAAKLTWS